MKNTGCRRCNEVQKETGDDAAMCPACEIEMLEAQIEADQGRIEELKAKLYKFKPGDIVQIPGSTEIIVQDSDGLELLSCNKYGVVEYTSQEILKEAGYRKIGELGFVEQIKRKEKGK